MVSAATAVVSYFSRLNPLWLFVLAGAAGLTGLL
jgi:hypothetical protein